jgi:ABC-2 type transport system ATP-binding protein
VLLNNSIEDITQNLKFVVQENVSESTLYSEPAMGGFACVEPNPDGIETKVNIEQLFNAAIQNKDLFKKLFTQN